MCNSYRNLILTRDGILESADVSTANGCVWGLERSINVNVDYLRTLRREKYGIIFIISPFGSLFRPSLDDLKFTVQINTLLTGRRVSVVNPLNAELNPISYLLALLAHHFLHVSRIRVKSLTLRLLMSCIYIWSAYS